MSIPVLFAAQVARAPEAVAISCGERSWTYRELDEAVEPVGAPAGRLRVRVRGSVWRCCFPVPPRRSWRSWRCSRPGRPICRSTRRMPAARIGFMIADAAPIAAITTAGLADRLDGCDLLVIDVDDPASTPNPAPHCRRRPPMTSPTSSTPRAPPVSPRGWRSPTTT